MINQGPLTFQQAKINELGLLEAAVSGDIEAVKNFIRAKIPVNGLNEDNMTPLMMASMGGHAQIVSHLLTAGADVNAIDKDGTTALMFAASCNSLEVVELLLEAQANLNISATLDGYTALMLAAYGGYLPIVKLLLEAKADVHLKNEDGDTALGMAIREGQKKCVDFLTDFEATLVSKNTLSEKRSFLR